MWRLARESEFRTWLYVEAAAMAREVLLGVDLGTTVLKVAAVEACSGKLLGMGARRLPVRVAAGGGREQSLASVQRALRAAVGEVRNAVGPAWNGVGGVGLAAQGGSSLFAERESGKPCSPMYLWNDGRAYPYVGKLASAKPRSFWRRLFDYDSPPTGLGRLLWLRELHPELFGERHIHVGAGEFLFHRLTGVWRQDAGNAIQIGSYNAKAMRLDGAALELAGVPLSGVAPLRAGHETAPLSTTGARLLGLRAGLPVAGPYIDQEAGYMTAAAGAGRPLQCSLGTAWVGNFVLPAGTGGRSSTQMPIPSPLGEGRMIIQALLMGNTTWDWARGAFLPAGLEDPLGHAVALCARRPLPPAGLVALPWCTRANPLLPEAHGGGVLSGLSADTAPADLLRAVAAGMVFEFGRVFREVLGRGVVDRVLLGGGASRGAHFRKLVAALFAPLPVCWQIDEGAAAARGALFALSPRAARTRSRRVPVPGAVFVEEVQRAFGEYERVYDQVYGRLSDGGRFRFSARGKQRTR